MHITINQKTNPIKKPFENLFEENRILDTTNPKIISLKFCSQALYLNLITVKVR